MNLMRWVRTLAGLAAGLALVSIATSIYSPMATRHSAALLGSLFVIFLGPVVGICVLAAALGWLRKRRAARPGQALQDEGWGDGEAPWHLLPAGAWGALAACALGTAIFPPAKVIGPVAALALSVLGGWCQPDKLLRYLGSASLTLMTVLATAGLLLGFHGIFAGLTVAPIVIASVIPVGAVMFMAGAIVRHIAD